MDISAVLKDGSSSERNEPGQRLVIADNGVFLERDTPLLRSCTRVEISALGLETQTEYCTLRCGKISPVTHRAMLAFFEQAHQFHGGEAALVVLYNPSRGTYRLHCPLQVVDQIETRTGWYTSDRIEFENPLELPEDYIQLGDAHLHPGAPNPSALDIADDQDGLHIIVGTIASTPSYHVTFVIDGKRFSVPPRLIFEDPKCDPFGNVPTSWLKQLRVRQYPLKNKWTK